MTTATPLGNHVWTESEYLAMGETSERIELFDGSLHVSPDPLPRHLYVAGELTADLRPAAQRAGFYLLGGGNVRLRANRICIPDLVITTKIDLDELMIDPVAVQLVCEILSPSNATTDKVVKMRYYAEAGIPWYLVVDPRISMLSLYRLDGDRYLEHAIATPGTLLELTEPVTVTIDPADLLPPG